MRHALALLALLAAPAALAQTFDPRPTAGSPAASGAVFTHARVSGPFFTPTTYRGAFEPGGERWDLPWANYNPQQTVYGGSTAASGAVVLSGTLATRTLTTGTRYRLQGFVTVPSGAVLTIQPGVILFGERSSTASLIVERGGRIEAVGTAQQPIVFTSEFAPGSRANGDWGGIILAGRAAVNLPGGTGVIEGGTGTTYGGGAAPDANDTSGTLTYVRIEFAGIAFSPNNEINSLTLGAVGRGTIIDYVQCSFGGDDAFEPFGGTVNLRHVIANAPVDDLFDGDNGWTGNVQFALGISNPDIADVSGSNGIENDNDGSGSGNTPLTAPTFSNVTILGPRTQTTGAINANFKRGAHIRRNARTAIFNSVILGFEPGLLLDGSGTVGAAQSGALAIEGTVVTGAVLDVSTTSGAGDTGAALAFFNGRPGNLVATSAAAAGFGGTIVGADSGPSGADGLTLSVSPNPATSGAARLTLTLPEATPARITVYDVLGREVAVVADRAFSEGEQTVALEARLPAGVYVARVQTTSGTATVPFTVVR